MTELCDLHTHSAFSDGTCTPEELIELAVSAKLHAIALTDHNTVAGLDSFLSAAKGTSVEAIPGVEISTDCAGTEIHIVGLYLAREKYGELMDFLSIMLQRKDASNRHMVEALARDGYELDYDEIKAHNKGSVNRAVIAAELMKKGYVSSIRDTVEGLLSAKRGYYIPPERLKTTEAIAFLSRIGAVPVLAHPYFSMNVQQVRSLLPEAKASGLVAMETRYSTYSPEITELARETAREFGLLESGGSDFHGENKPDIKLGVGRGDLRVPLELARTLAGAI